MHIKEKAFYTTLRMEWLNNKNLAVEPWQVDDYQAMELSALLDQLALLCTPAIECKEFITLAQEFSSPEELTDYLTQRSSLKPGSKESVEEFDRHDHLYLVVFELWKRLLPGKRPLSIFCDTLDQAIFLYDQGANNQEELLALLVDLDNLLWEKSSAGSDPPDLLEELSTSCAHDIESFLYHFIMAKIDAEELEDAVRLLARFRIYGRDPKWFQLIDTRLLFLNEDETAEASLQTLVEEAIAEPEVDFSFELLALLTEGQAPRATFALVALHLVPLIQSEGDFQELLVLLISFFNEAEDARREGLVKELLISRADLFPEDPFLQEDGAIFTLLQILQSSSDLS